MDKKELQEKLKNVLDASERARTVFNQLQGQRMLLEGLIADIDKPKKEAPKPEASKEEKKEPVNEAEKK